jgi:hypothetical protein
MAQLSSRTTKRPPAARGWTLHAAVLTVATLATTSACVDVRGFAGRWEGPASSEKALLQGFGPGVTVKPLEVEDITLTEVQAVFTTDDGTFSNTRLEPIDRLTGDALSSITFDGAPLRTYMLFADLAAEPSADAAWVVLSLFGDNRIELRVMRRNDLFAVFQLRRQE